VAQSEERTTLVQGVAFECPMAGQQDTEVKEYLEVEKNNVLDRTQVNFDRFDSFHL
jgi:hypothetical protein